MNLCFSKTISSQNEAERNKVLVRFLYIVLYISETKGKVYKTFTVSANFAIRIPILRHFIFTLARVCSRNITFFTEYLRVMKTASILTILTNFAIVSPFKYDLSYILYSKLFCDHFLVSSTDVRSIGIYRNLKQLMLTLKTGKPLEWTF